ncbi:hypothetical protein SSX86_000208 [Deinandra increscens subsp. villosa]|uniref:Uncharacterized protein n=1 Tax=Deinandra increscens subsp. villosa TaxID=3103831 RepID=A0AAP0DW43_9ASTR
MGIANYRGMMIFFVFIMLLSTQSETVSASRSIDLALRWGEGRLFSRHSRVLKGEELVSIAPTPAAMMFDPNQSNKRRIRRGSDPIHNTR